MTNVLNSILTNQPIYTGNQSGSTSFTFDSTGRVKPMKDKGKLLPSRIIGSPIEYAKDLKKDIISIGKAAKGEANDHELGRINDVAMKLGSLGLASYLFVRNPLKLSKTMEFVGFGTFFASMALWPKLAIQAPLKARTGVDIHQKYVDSQGRKKMLYQDPQYVLTDLYTKEDLNKIGKKLNVNEKLPDRDNFIKQRAQKTALQGNTLWMMTAGIASPTMSALACKAIEDPLGNFFENQELKASAKALEAGYTPSIFAKFTQARADKQFTQFIDYLSGRKLDGKTIKEIASRITAGTNASIIKDAVEEEIKGIASVEAKMDMDFVKEALKNVIPEAKFNQLTTEQKKLLEEAISNGATNKIAQILGGKRGAAKIENALNSAKQNKSVAIVDDKAKTIIKSLYGKVTEFNGPKGLIDRFIHARVGNEADTYIAKQWGRFGNQLVKSLGLKTKDLKKLANGDMSVLEAKLAEVAASGNEKEYDKLVKALMKLVTDYEEKTKTVTPEAITERFSSAFCQASSRMKDSGFAKVADAITGCSPAGTLEQEIKIHAHNNIAGAQSSFYRLLQTLDLYKQISNGSFEKHLRQHLSEAKTAQVSDLRIKELIDVSKKVLMSSTPTDYAEKLKSTGYNLTTAEYKAVMQSLFGENSTSLSMFGERTLSGLKAYKEQFMNGVANWRNGITVQLGRCTVTGENNALKSSSELIGDPLEEMVKKFAKKAYNTKTWVHIFGGVMLAITAATIIGGLFIGRKSATEKQVEAENKLNG